MYDEGRESVNDRGTNWQNLLDQAVAFFRSRKSEHWVMFFIGLIIGLIVG